MTRDILSGLEFVPAIRAGIRSSVNKKWPEGKILVIGVISYGTSITDNVGSKLKVISVGCYLFDRSKHDAAMKDVNKT
jgi:hypothetical protein